MNLPHLEISLSNVLFLFFLKFVENDAHKIITFCSDVTCIFQRSAPRISLLPLAHLFLLSATLFFTM